MPRQRVDFLNTRGQKLAGILDRPPADPVGTALFAHCFTCSKDSIAAYRVGRALSERGIATLRFDFAGLGDSEGDLLHTSLTDQLDDLRAASAFLAETLSAPDILVGHSLGGLVALIVAPTLASLRGVVVIAASADTRHLHTLLSRSVRSSDREEVEVFVGGRSVRLGRRFFADLETYAVEGRVTPAGPPLLVVHAQGDRIVPIRHAQRICAAAGSRAQLVALPHDDHLLSHRPHADEVGRVIGEWASERLAG